MNFILAGKAHPADEPGKSVLKLILSRGSGGRYAPLGAADMAAIHGAAMASADGMLITVTGMGGHAAKPELAREAHDWILRAQRSAVGFAYYARRCLRNNNDDCLE